MELDPKRPYQISAKRLRWLHEWHRLMPPAPEVKLKVPGWVIVAAAEIDSMFLPAFRAQYRTFQQFAHTPRLVGLFCGYWQAITAHARDHPEAMERLRPGHGRIAIEARAGMFGFIRIYLGRTSLLVQREFAAGLKQGLDHDPFYTATGRPVQGRRHNRWEALVFLVNNYQTVEREFVAKRRTRAELHAWLQAELAKQNKIYDAGPTATQNLCDEIGLRLRPHSKPRLRTATKGNET